MKNRNNLQLRKFTGPEGGLAHAQAIRHTLQPTSTEVEARLDHSSDLR